MAKAQSKQGEGQDRNVFNTHKRYIRDIGLLTDEQLAETGFEIWHEARMRSGVRIEEELAKIPE